MKVSYIVEEIDEPPYHWKMSWRYTHADGKEYGDYCRYRREEEADEIFPLLRRQAENTIKAITGGAVDQ